MEKITKEQVKSFLSGKEWFEESNIIFFVEYQFEGVKGGIAFNFDRFEYLIDVYTWND